MAAHGVAVESRNSCLREESMQQLFQFFRACSEKIDVLAPARRAVLRHRSHESAVVALHPPLRLMVGQRDGTVLALERFAASSTQDHRGISAAVEQHHGLLFSL